MNENIDLTKILKNCPKGTEFWSPLYDTIELYMCQPKDGIIVRLKTNILRFINADATIIIDGIKSPTIMLYPSKDQRDWSKFTAPWYKKEKFDPKTLNPFDRVLVKCTSIYNSNLVWRAGLFSYFYVEDNSIRVYTLGSDDNSPKSYVIPYNADTKHLVNTEIEAPEYYRYWED